MADPKGFLKFKRQKTEYRPVCERIKDYKEVMVLRAEEKSKEQASRCMDCGTPFCHWACPIGNYIPEWNDLMFRDQWREALGLLLATNNMPEITGRVCPAMCEYGCVLGINDDPATIKDNELGIVEYAFKKGLIKPNPPKKRTGKKVAVIGSGPAGLTVAAQLNQAGHKVTVFEKYDEIGGILRYGIPDFKLEKWVIDRRVDLWKKEGIEFKTRVNVGLDYSRDKLLEDFDAVCLCIGSRVPRDLKIPGRQLQGIHFAMDYLTQSNRRVAGKKISKDKLVDAKGKKVVVIGAGDTGADCVGTAHRQKASCVVQIELLQKPPECRTEEYPWPIYPMLLKTSTSHQEGGERHWSVLTKKFIGAKGKVKKVFCVKVKFAKQKGATCLVMKEIPGSEFEIEADLVILAVGFLHPQHKGLIKDLGLGLDEKGNIKTNAKFQTSQKSIFSCGDCHRGQSLIVWAIAEGRRTAYYVDSYLMGDSSLPFL